MSSRSAKSRSSSHGATVRAERAGVGSLRFEPRAGAAGGLKRTELVRQCQEVAPGCIVLLEAPAGFGKTALFAQWHAALRALEQSVVWIPLRPSDRDWSSLASTFNAALTHAGLPEPAETSQSPVVDTERSIEAFVDSLVDGIRERNVPATLLIDDFQNAESTSSESLLRALFERLPDNVVVGIASRHVLPFSVSRWLLQGRVLRLDKRSLLFSKNDIRASLKGPLSPAELQSLYTLTEGWPAAIKIAEMCVEEWRRKAGSLDVLPAYARLTRDFCTAEALRSVDADAVALLLDSAIFETIEPDLCDAVRGREDSAMRIAELAARETFLDTIDITQNTWAIPKVLRHSLMQRAAEYGSTKLATIHGLAAERYEARGNTLEAVRHYMAAADAPRAALAFERVSPMSLACQQGDDCAAAILDLIPSHCLLQFPRLALCRAYVDYKQGFLEEARYLHESVSARTNGFTQDRDGGAEAQLKAESLAAALVLDLYRLSCVSRAYLATAEEQIATITRANPRLAGFAHELVGILYVMRGDLDVGRSHFIQCEKLTAQEPAPWVDLWLVYHRGSLALAHGDLMEAKYHLHAGLKRWRKDFPAAKAFGAAANLLLADIDYEHDALEDSQAKVNDAIYTVENTEGWYEHYSTAYEIAVMILLHSQRPDDAEAFLTRAASNKRVRTVLEDFLGLLRLRMAVMRTSARDAALVNALHELSEKWNRPTCDEEFSWRAWDLAGLCLCHVAIQDNDLSRAVEVLDKLERAARKQRRGRALAKALILRSACSFRSGDRDSAVAQMSQALEAGSTQGYRRTFLDEGALIRPVLLLIAHGKGVAARLASFAAKLLDAIDSRSQDFSMSAARLLSEREADVLHELSQGHSNKIISRKLALREPTVKFHLQNIFRKLGVRRRDAAVAEAKRRGLLE